MATEVLPCKLVAQLAFKAGGDLFHEITSSKPHHMLPVAPAKLQACAAHTGEFGKVGSVIHWNYTLDGKQQTAKHLVQDIDKEKKQVTYKWIEGDLLELYKDLVMTMHVETKGDVEFATCTLEYELLKPENPHPVSVLNFLIELTKELETHALG